MTSSELCLAGIVEYLVTGAGKKENMETLAAWGFENALEAYWTPSTTGRTQRIWRTSSARIAEPPGRDPGILASRSSHGPDQRIHRLPGQEVGEQAMQKTIDELKTSIKNKDMLIEEKERAIDLDFTQIQEK